MKSKKTVLLYHYLTMNQFCYIFFEQVVGGCQLLRHLYMKLML